MTTKAQIAANRKNAKKSTGPKSPDGKNVTKFNGLTHGLRAGEVVLPNEDPAAFRAHMDAWMADWNPPTMARAQLVEDAAIAAWRKKRCVRVETARLGERIDGLLAGWHREEQAKLDGALAGLFDQPRQAIGALLGSRAGVDRLIGLWSRVAEGARSIDSWDDVRWHHFLVIALHGLCPGDPEAADLRDASYRLYLRNAPEEMYDEETDPEPLNDDEAEPVAALFRHEAGRRIDSLRRMRESLPDLAAQRARRAEAEAFEPRPEDAAMLRYEAQLSRQFHRALNDLVKLAASGADLSEPEAIAPTEPNSAEVSDSEEVEGDFSEPSGPSEPGATLPRGPSEPPVGPSDGLNGVAGPVSGPLEGPHPAPNRS